MSLDPQRLKELFLGAAAIADSREREAWLAQQYAPEPELLAKVRALLRAREDPQSFLDLLAPAAASQPGPSGEKPSLASPDMAGTMDVPVQPEGPGTHIGPYKLLQEIGSGGMGAVYMAEQEQPVRRKVALKIIKPGMDSAQVIARFEAERQALALMDHQNIARVLDAGATPSGRPYFVMELVKGIPITKFCDEQHLTPRERLELFVPVCQAIQHAHQKGIIHRDIKPSNVLVTLYDGKPVPKVIDFGVAKAIEQRLTERTLFTQLGQVVGTVEYMSPEQAELNALDIDTRSDIYSLGVLLYELLTGSTPLEKHKLRSAGFNEILRMIREEEPPRPSTRLSASGEQLPSISAQRKTEPAKLAKLMRGELDWMVMKALEKDRQRRYETANGFARDIERYLADEPVEACPPSIVYKMRKFARKNRKALVTVGAFVILLAVLTGSAGWVLGDRAARQDEAEGKAREALEAALPALRNGNPHDSALIAAVERAQAQLTTGVVGTELRVQVEQLRHDQQMLALMEQARLQAAAGSKETGFDYAGADQLYAQAFAGYGVELSAAGPQEAAERVRASAIATHLVAALDDWATARNRLRPGTGASLGALADLADDDLWRRGVRAAVAKGNRSALEALAQETAPSKAPADLVWLARALRAGGAATVAEGLLWRAQRERPADFWISFELAFTLNTKQPPELAQAVRFYQAALALRPQSPMLYTNLGSALGKQGKLVEAEAAARKAIQLHPGLALAHSNLGNALWSQGKPAEAEAAVRRAIELRPISAEAHNNLGIALNLQGKRAEAEKAFHQAIRIEPNFALAHYNLGVALSEQGKLPEAESAYRKAIHFEPGDANLHQSLGIVLMKQRKVPEAEAAHRRAAQLRPDFVQAHYNLGVALAAQGKFSEAEAAFRQAVLLQPDYGEGRYNLAYTLELLNRLTEAAEAYRRAIQFMPLPETAEAFRRAIQSRPIPEAHCNLGGVLLRQGKFTEAVAAYRRGHELGSSRPGWPFPSQKWLALAEKAAALAAKQPHLLQGQVKGELSLAELTTAVTTLWNMRRYRSQFRLLTAIFQTRPELVAQFGDNAADAAAMVARGQEQYELDDREREHWRNQALKWLRGALDLTIRRLANADDAARREAQASLGQWLKKPALVELRDPAALARLPAAERQAWQKLWTEIEATRKKLAKSETIEPRPSHW